MTVLTQGFAHNDEYRPPPRTYRRRPRFKIKKTPTGFVWLSKKKRILTKPAATKSEAKRRAKEKLKAIKLSKRKARLTRKRVASDNVSYSLTTMTMKAMKVAIVDNIPAPTPRKTEVPI